MQNRSGLLGRRSLVFSVLLAMFPVSAAMAQEQAGELATTEAAEQLPAKTSVTALAPMVVTASGFEQKITDAPASITVVTREQLQSRPYTSLVDALRDVEGIDVGDSVDKNGQASISMRGLGSDYTLVLIDGKRQSNTGNIYPNDFGGGQFSYVPPLDSVDRIEVIRGPMSTRYGSDAIGGVVNIITRKVAQKTHGSVSTSLTLQENSQFGHEKTQDLYVATPLIKEKLGLSVRGSYYDRDTSSPRYESLTLPDGSEFNRSLSYGGGGAVAASVSWNAGFRLSFTPTQNHDFSLDYSTSKQTYDNSPLPNGGVRTGTIDSAAGIWRSGTAATQPYANPYYDPTKPTSANNPLEFTVRTVQNPTYNPANPLSATNRPFVNVQVVKPQVGYTPEQRFNREQWSFTHNGRWSFGNSEISLTRSSSSNLGRSLPLTVAERDSLQTLWDASCTQVSGQCTTAQNPLTAALTTTLNAQYLPRPVRVLEVDNLIFDANLDLQFGSHQVGLGGQYLDSDMEDGAFGLFGDGFRAGTVQPHKQWAVFVEDNWTLIESVTLSAGVRYDDHNIFGGHVSPRGYVVWRASDYLTVKGGVSTGYKAPRPDQLFPGITGFGSQGANPFVGTPDLQPETSVNTELALYYDNPEAGYSVNVTVFQTEFKDKIATGDAVANCEVAPAGERCVDIGPGWAELGHPTFSQSTNIDKAESKGVELAGSVQLPARVSLRGNYTLTDSEQKSGINAGKPITGNPAKHMLNATVNWEATAQFSLFLTAEYRGERYRDTINVLAPGSTQVIGTEDRYFKDYEIFHLGASFKATEFLTFNTRINNLLNKDFISQSCILAATGDSYSCTDDYRIKDRGRNYWLSATMRF